MKILFYCINFSPDLIGIPKYNGEMCEWLAEKGYEVNVITGKPYYPEWQSKPHASYQSIYFTEQKGNLTIHRCPFYIPSNPTTFKKIIHECTFPITSSYLLLKQLFIKYDVMIVISPPFHLGLWAYMFSKLNKVPIVYHIQDLQVDVAKELKLVKNAFLLSLLENLENFILSKMAIVTTISEGMKAKLILKNANIKQLALFPNWVDTNFIKPLPKEQPLRKEFGIEDSDFVVLYSGNMGEKQGLEYVIEAAEQLKDNSGIKFIMVGDGGGKQNLMKKVLEKKLNNIHFFPLQPYEKLPQLLAIGDVHLVLQKKDAADLILPSKLTSILASGGVTLATANEDSFLCQTIKSNELGIVVESENTRVLIDAILFIKNNQNETIKYKQNAVAFAAKYLDKENILTEFESLLSNISRKY